MKTLRLPRRGLAAFSVVTAVAAAASSSAPAAAHAATPCRSIVSDAVIPAWARGGFSEPKPRVTHVLGRSDSIIAILFGARTLHAPPATGRNNKILWIARRQPSLGDMHIRAQRMRGTQLLGKPVSRLVPGGPGPSTIDLPAAGCWRFTLTWKTGHDTLDLGYAARS